MKTTTRCFLTSALALSMVATTQAVTFFRPVANGNWNAPATWDQNAVPNDSTKYPVIQDGRTVTLDASMGTYTIYDFIVGYSSGTSTLNISGGGFTTAKGDEFMVGGNAAGIINQTGGTITVPVGNVQFCAPWGNAVGTWNLSGGTMNVANSIIHNKPTANVATVQLTGGTMTFGTWGDGMPDLVNNGTTISPGLTGTARTSNVNMNFIQHSGALQLDIGDGGSDFIRMHNSVYGGTVVADLSGTLELNALGAITQGVWFNVLETDGGAITDNLSLADPVNWVKRVSGNVLQVKFTGTPDSTPPVVVTVSPADNATDVPLDTNLGITFNESVVPGSGNIEILDWNYNLIESIDVTSGAVSFAGALVAINPVGNLGNSTGYYVESPAGVIKDLAGNDFAGIGDKTVWNLTSAAPQAQIVFTQQGFHAATDLSTAGTLIAAVNLGTTTAATLNGITFTGNNTGSVTAGGVKINFFGSDFIPYGEGSLYNGTTVTGVDADNLLDTWGYAYHPGQADGSVDLIGLTVGRTYKVQLLLSDDRGFAAGRTIDVVSGYNPKVPGPGEINQADFTSRSDSSALLVTGTFTATTNTQSLFITTTGLTQDAGPLAALQLRDVTGVATPYENWASSNGIPGEASTADHDNDGLSNGTEYALGLSPTQPNGAPGTLTGNVISFTKGAEAIANGDVTYIIEESDDLGSWSAVVTQTPPNTDPAISYTLPTGKPKEFVRLKVIIE